jgi:hypothetical protein
LTMRKTMRTKGDARMMMRTTMRGGVRKTMGDDAKRRTTMGAM